eukprot:CAMPEP_0195522722 /NCGR_PEP_ID=MMETSP0794_2-20130614/21175_1 /TAXON_ID=515487 /ORGANISM="Stephanopyxis turris, Strain CCMP 815" /LENGTH=102 /DNA_ID=CAMNT_0040652551 /DNA_START=71 /DNA_END=379 /DNA_ORIENTATION=+
MKRCIALLVVLALSMPHSASSQPRVAERTKPDRDRSDRNILPASSSAHYSSPAPADPTQPAVKQPVPAPHQQNVPSPTEHPAPKDRSPPAPSGHDHGDLRRR